MSPVDLFSIVPPLPGAIEPLDVAVSQPKVAARSHRRGQAAQKKLTKAVTAVKAIAGTAGFNPGYWFLSWKKCAACSCSSSSAAGKQQQRQGFNCFGGRRHNVVVHGDSSDDESSIDGGEPVRADLDLESNMEPMLEELERAQMLLEDQRSRDILVKQRQRGELSNAAIEGAPIAADVPCPSFSVHKCTEQAAFQLRLEVDCSNDAESGDDNLQPREISRSSAESTPTFAPISPKLPVGRARAAAAAAAVAAAGISTSMPWRMSYTTAQAITFPAHTTSPDVMLRPALRRQHRSASSLPPASPAQSQLPGCLPCTPSPPSSCSRSSIGSSKASNTKNRKRAQSLVAEMLAGGRQQYGTHPKGDQHELNATFKPRFGLGRSSSREGSLGVKCNTTEASGRLLKRDGTELELPEKVGLGKCNEGRASIDGPSVSVECMPQPLNGRMPHFPSAPCDVDKSERLQESPPRWQWRSPSPLTSPAGPLEHLALELERPSSQANLTLSSDWQLQPLNGLMPQFPSAQCDPEKGERLPQSPLEQEETQPCHERQSSWSCSKPSATDTLGLEPAKLGGESCEEDEGAESPLPLGIVTSPLEPGSPQTPASFQDCPVLLTQGKDASDAVVVVSRDLVDVAPADAAGPLCLDEASESDGGTGEQALATCSSNNSSSNVWGLSGCRDGLLAELPRRGTPLAMLRRLQQLKQLDDLETGSESHSGLPQIGS